MITRKNYEAYFLDYHEGNLTGTEIKLLDEFLATNTDLKEELDGFEAILLPDNPIIFENKRSLKRKSAGIFFTHKRVAYLSGIAASLLLTWSIIQFTSDDSGATNTSIAAIDDQERYEMELPTAFIKDESKVFDAVAEQPKRRLPNKRQLAQHKTTQDKPNEVISMPVEDESENKALKTNSRNWHSVASLDNSAVRISLESRPIDNRIAFVNRADEQKTRLLETTDIVRHKLLAALLPSRITDRMSLPGTNETLQAKAVLPAVEVDEAIIPRLYAFVDRTQTRRNN